MPDPNDTTPTTFQDWTLRVREATQAPARLLLLIHGLTGDENSMWVFARDLPPHYWIVAPRAPHLSGMPQGGYSWRPADSEAEDRPSLEQLQPAVEALLRFVDDYAASVGLDAATFDVMGFSQGAAMSSLLAFLHPKRVRKAGLLAGFVPGGLDGLLSQRPLEGKPFFVAHGTKDETIPIARARSSVDVLEQAGAQVTFCEDDVGHKVSITCLKALKKFLIN